MVCSGRRVQRRKWVEVMFHPMNREDTQFLEDVKDLRNDGSVAPVLPKEAVFHIRALLKLGAEDFGDSLVNPLPLSGFVGLPPDLVHWVTQSGVQFWSHFLENDMSEIQRRRAIEGVDTEHLGLPAEAFLIVVDALEGKKLTTREQLALVGNTALFSQLLNFPDILDTLIPDKGLVLKKLFRVDSYDPDRKEHVLEKYFSHGQKTDDVLDLAVELFVDSDYHGAREAHDKTNVGDNQRWHSTYGRLSLISSFMGSLLCYQKLTYDHLIRLGVGERNAYCLARKGDDVPEPEWKRDDLGMVGENISEERFLKCVRSKRKGLIRWLAVTCHEEWLPTMISLNDKTVQEILGCRLKGEKARFRDLRAALVSTIFNISCFDY